MIRILLGWPASILCGGYIVLSLVNGQPRMAVQHDLLTNQSTPKYQNKGLTRKSAIGHLRHCFVGEHMVNNIWSELS
jgi:hypothetical protein